MRSRIPVLAALAVFHSGAVAGAADRNPYVRDANAVRRALARLAQETLVRPSPDERLFVEGYFIRALVAAHEVQQSAAGIAPALAFADSLVARQGSHGYWKIGYGTSWLADMGAALGVFHALEPHADSSRVRRWQECAERFVRALRRDQLITASGAVGFGWPVESTGLVRAYRSDVGWADDPYLVSTALVGIELQAWLYRRTRDEIYRTGAVAALEWTLSQLAPDGALPSRVRGEGVYTVAAYVEEGWMAADLLLEDPELHARLCDRLAAHVDWLLRTQNRDGAWESTVRGDFARTPGILGFLVWYDRRCVARRDVQQAVQRASRLYGDPQLEIAALKLDTGPVREIFRALLGRPLAALVAGRPVL